MSKKTVLTNNLLLAHQIEKQIIADTSKNNVVQQQLL